MNTTRYIFYFVIISLSFVNAAAETSWAINDDKLVSLVAKTNRVMIRSYSPATISSKTCDGELARLAAMTHTHESNFNLSADNLMNGDILKENNYAYFIAYDKCSDNNNTATAIGVITLCRNSRSIEISMWLDKSQQRFGLGKEIFQIFINEIIPDLKKYQYTHLSHIWLETASENSRNFMLKYGNELGFTSTTKDLWATATNFLK